MSWTAASTSPCAAIPSILTPPTRARCAGCATALSPAAPTWGFYISVRGFTADARHFAETAPVQLLDCEEFIHALSRVRKAVKVSPVYKAMCRHCGDIVRHSLDDSTPKRCANDHTVPQPMSRADFEKPRPSGPAQPAAAMLPRVFRPASGKYLDKSPKAARRRAIKAQNYSRWRAQASRLPYRSEP